MANRRHIAMTLPEAESMALMLMRHHGVRGYTFGFMQPRGKFSRIGQCNFRRKRIELAPFFVRFNYPFVVKRTILHEIAHALTPKHGHNKFWKAKARELGHDGSRCYTSKLVKRSP